MTASDPIADALKSDRHSPRQLMDMEMSKKILVDILGYGALFCIFAFVYKPLSAKYDFWPAFALTMLVTLPVAAFWHYCYGKVRHNE